MRDTVENGYWLPENVALHLSSLEAGYLMAILMENQAKGENTTVVNKPGPYGTKIQIHMIDRLVEKLNEAVNQSRK